MTGPPMADGIPGRQHLTGYRLRDYEHLIATLDASRRSTGALIAALARHAGCSESTIGAALRGTHRINGHALVDLAYALGYDLALIPREDT